MSVCFDDEVGWFFLIPREVRVNSVTSMNLSFNHEGVSHQFTNFGISFLQIQLITTTNDITIIYANGGSYSAPT